MQRAVFYFTCFLWLILLPRGLAQERHPNHFKAVGLPLAFYSPDTRWGGGGGALLTFNFPRDSVGARRSSITLGAVYTQLNQLLLYAPFQLFPNNQRWWIGGELGYYRYVYNFFGIGNDIPEDYIEKYDATFPRFRLNLSRKIAPGLFLGPRWAFDRFVFSRLQANGLLASGSITGSRGGRVSGLGLGINYDTRNLLFFPSKGWLIDAAVYAEWPGIGSDFRYQRLSIDVARYLPMGARAVLALNGAVVFSPGNPPFHQMPLIGGTRRMRGYFEGKYRDKHLLLLQAEWRQPIKGRLGAVLFGGLAQVYADASALVWRHTRCNFGTGLRVALDNAQKINLRADYGIGYRSSGFYLTLGEAF
jgi:outer membrane protein assembly factor BamA